MNTRSLIRAMLLNIQLQHQEAQREGREQLNPFMLERLYGALGSAITQRMHIEYHVKNKTDPDHTD
jgi:hypothetical protein